MCTLPCETTQYIYMLTALSQQSIHVYIAFTFVLMFYTQRLMMAQTDGDMLLTCKCTVCHKYLTVYLFNRQDQLVLQTGCR